MNVMTAVEPHFYKDAKPDSHQLRRRRDMLGLLSGLKGKVLDYGCGWGDLSYQFSKTNPVRGVDADPERVAFAKDQYAPIEFSVCRTDGLDFDDASFDIVLSTVVINFVSEPADYLAEISRVLTPDGRLIICVRNPPVIRNWVRKILGQPPAPPHVPYLPERRDFMALLDQQGFEVEQHSCFYDPPFKDWKGIRDAIFGTAEQILSVFGVRTTAPYYSFRCRKKT